MVNHNQYHRHMLCKNITSKYINNFLKYEVTNYENNDFRQIDTENTFARGESILCILKVHCNLSEPDVTGTGIFSRCDQIS